MQNRHSPERIASIDGLRGLAILIVLLHNPSFILRASGTFATKLVSAVAATGWAGVQIFFVLSGFLITGLLLDSVGAPGYFRTFYLRRTLRIFPLYYAVLAVAFLIVPAISHTPWNQQVAANAWWYWAYVSNWGDAYGHGIDGLSHFWSLAVEEQFYLVWPLLVAVLSRVAFLRACAALVIVGPLIRLALVVAGLPDLAISEVTIARMDALAAGALLATLARREGGHEWLERWHFRLGMAGALIAAAVLVMRRGFHEGDPVVQVAGQSGIILMAAAVLHACSSSLRPAGLRLRAALSARWLRFLGKYSYAIYVFHWPIHSLLAPHVGDLVNMGGQWGRVGRLALYLGTVGVLSIAAALISWRVIESPLLILKDRVAPRHPESARSVAANA